MPDSKRSTSSLSSVKGESTIAFAYIRILRSGKKRFFALKSVPKASPYDEEGTKPLDYSLYMFKNEKTYHRNEPKLVYNLNDVILLSRCTKKDNSTVLGICFQDDALFLKFSSEDELNRWYFHLNEIYNVKRNFRWPELLNCYSVTLKPKNLASSSAKHGRPELPGQYRFCLTESAVLLVRNSLLNPELCLPFPCIRSLVEFVSSSTAFQIHLGRLSPIGEGVLHFEVEQSCMLKELTETLLRRLNEAKGRVPPDGGKPSNRGARRSSKDSASIAGSQYPDSFKSVMRRGGSVRIVSQNGDKAISTFSERAPSMTYSYLSDSQRTHSQPLGDSFDDYCDLSRDLARDTPTTKSQQSNNRSLDSSCSLSGNSELADGATAAAGIHSSHQRSPPSGNDPESGVAARIANWRFNCQGAASPGLGSRANSIGDRPQASRPGSYLPSSYSVPSTYYGEPSQTAGHREDRQVFVELNFSRPRTTSDASRHRFGIRSRTGSYGNRNAYRLNGPGPTTPAVEETLASFDQFDTLMEAGTKEECGDYVPISLGASAASSSPRHEPEEREELPDEDDYWMSPSRVDKMLMKPTVGQLHQQCPVEH